MLRLISVPWMSLYVSIFNYLLLFVIIVIIEIHLVQLFLLKSAGLILMISQIKATGHHLLHHHQSIHFPVCPCNIVLWPIFGQSLLLILSEISLGLIRSEFRLILTELTCGMQQTKSQTAVGARFQAWMELDVCLTGLTLPKATRNQMVTMM
jgi:hypothetical protein